MNKRVYIHCIVSATINVGFLLFLYNSPGLRYGESKTTDYTVIRNETVQLSYAETIQDNNDFTGRSPTICFVGDMLVRHRQRKK